MESVRELTVTVIQINSCLLVFVRKFKPRSCQHVVKTSFALSYLTGEMR